MEPIQIQSSSSDEDISGNERSEAQGQGRQPDVDNGNQSIEIMNVVIPPPGDQYGNDIDLIEIRNEVLIHEEKPKQVQSSQPKNDSGSDSDNEAQGCPICFEQWTNSGSHRLCSLNCGHLFGRSCIERWLKGKSSDKCPQCNCPAKRRDIRNLYCKALKVIDTSERDRALAALEEEKKRRAKAEEAHMRTKLQFEMVRAEVERLKEQVKTAHYKQQVLQQKDRLSSSQSSSQSTSRKSFILQKIIQIAQNNARVMAFDRQHGMMAVSKPSPNQLFPGFGVVKVSSLESRSSEYVSIHQKVVRDVCFNSRGDKLLLSASMDKSLKLTSMASNTVVQSYTCPAPVWCCRWNEADTNFIYCGLQNGSCLVYDIRNTESSLRCLQVPSGVPCPIVSIAYVPRCQESNFSAEGLLVGTLNGGWFWELCPDSQYLPHPLNLTPGSLTGISFEENTRHCMASYRPSKYFPNTKHVIYKLTGSGIATSGEQSLCSITPIQQCTAGSISKALSRSALFTCVDDNDNLYTAAGDEGSNSTHVWDCSNGAQIQKIPSHMPALDVLHFNTNGRSFLATLTEQKLGVYRWD